MDRAARTPSDLMVMAQAGMLPDARRSDGMITVSIDPQTFSNMRSELDWSRGELARLREQLARYEGAGMVLVAESEWAELRAANEALAREVRDLRSAARYMADAIFAAGVEMERAQAARRDYLRRAAPRPDTTTEDARQAASGLDG